MAPEERKSSAPITLRSRERGPFAFLAEDVQRGLSANPKELPPKYFYDARGSRLFEEICDLPEYYPTRTEQALLETIADDLIASCRPSTLVEFGSGSSRKTRILLESMERRGLLEFYVPIDVSGEMIRQTADALRSRYPGLRVQGVIADFNLPVTLPRGRGPRLLIFLGSTIGNLNSQESISFLRRVADLLSSQDRFLLGTDLVKDVAVLERAYNDSRGVTAAFNRNVLAVINERLGANFRPEGFEHRAFYNREQSRTEMHLAAREAHRVWIEEIGMAVDFARGESIRTEISCKYTRESVEAMLEAAGLRLLRWETDERNWFGLSLSARRP
jgi:L-histidine Nalpha-methyltransferase